VAFVSDQLEELVTQASPERRDRFQQERFDDMLSEAKNENEKMRVRCALIATAQRARTGGCPPGDKLCAAGE
jgi:hypothetical protein